MLYWWPGWLICLEHEAIDVDDKVFGHSEFPTFFLACWLVDWLHVTLNRKLGFFRYALIIGPLASSFLSLHQISYTRVTIRAPLGRGFAASRSVAIKQNPKRHGWTDGKTDGQTDGQTTWKQYTPNKAGVWNMLKDTCILQTLWKLNKRRWKRRKWRDRYGTAKSS